MFPRRGVLEADALVLLADWRDDGLDTSADNLEGDLESWSDSLGVRPWRVFSKNSATLERLGSCAGSKLKSERIELFDDDLGGSTDVLEVPFDDGLDRSPELLDVPFDDGRDGSADLLSDPLEVGLDRSTDSRVAPFDEGRGIDPLV